MGFSWWDNDESYGISAQEIADRVHAEWRAEKSGRAVTVSNIGAAPMWPTGWPHEAPEDPLSVSEAHQTMQRHKGCRTDGCPRKAAALRTLVVAGRVVPDPSRELR